MPLIRRLPKRGFSNVQYCENYNIVNVDSLSEKFEEGAEVGPETLAEAGLLHKKDWKVKLLGEGQISKPLTVRVHKASKSAIDKITSVGGKIELIT
jgi:large subunit ribosomal protein L15